MACEGPDQFISNPDVSFVVAARNMESFIARALQSALDQVGVTIEVLVVDDASTDQTASVLSEIAAGDPRVAVLRNKICLGPSGARNRALDAARGRWVAILDADDFISPMRAKTLLQIANDTGCTIVADNLMRFDTDLPHLSWPLLTTRDKHEGYFPVDVESFLVRNRITGGDANLGFLKPIFCRSFLQQYNLRYDEALRIGEDFDLYLRCLLAGGRLMMTTRAMYHYRVRRDSASRRLSSSNILSLIDAHKKIETSSEWTDELRRAHAVYRKSLQDGLAYLEFREAIRCRSISRMFLGGIRLRLLRAVKDISIAFFKRKIFVRMSNKPPIWQSQNRR